MLQSLIVYTFLLISMLWAAFSYSKSGLKRIRLKDPRIIFIILVYGIICGIRFDVGVDYLNYYQIYMTYFKYGGGGGLYISKEPGWDWYTKLLATNGYHYTIYFAVIAAIQISFVVFAFKRYPKLLPYVVLMFFLNGWFELSQNVLRQIVITFIFLFVAVRYPKISLFKAFVISIFATMIHTTGILIFVFLIFVKYDWKHFNIRPLFLIGFFLGLVAIGMLFNVLGIITSHPFMMTVLAATDYQAYANANHLEMGTKAVGLGFMLKTISNCIVISQYRNIIRAFPEYRFKSWFYCYYLGLCITMLFPTSILFTRMCWCLTIMAIPVYAAFFRYCFINIKVLYARSFRYQLGLSVLIFLLMLSATSLFISPKGANMEYHFYWEQITP